MARMIPPTIAPDTPSYGEREVFQRLRDDPATKDWIVLHSLDIPVHATQIAGEIDFVIIVPGKGVLCLEVKASRRIRRSQGIWYYGASLGDQRGPFKQASGAMHSLKDQLFKRRPDLSRIVFWSAVVFPYCEFNETSTEWHPWQLIDERAFRSQPFSVLAEEVLNQGREYLNHHPAVAWFVPDSGEPYPQQCKAIADALRGDFEAFQSPRAHALRLAEEVKHYTDEQTDALDQMAANDRVIFSGPAGTGKTLLAIEAARRGADAGQRVLFVCFNRMLGDWLVRQTAPLHHRIKVGTLHQVMLAVAGRTQVEEDAGSQFWKSELPDTAIERLLELKTDDYLFDLLVVDEAQDILHSSYLDFLDLNLRGGLGSGRWRVFGDFEKQRIYSTGVHPLRDFQNGRANHAPIYGLSKNCRNTPRIASLAHTLCGLDPGYSAVLRPDDQVDPEAFFYRSATQQRKHLVDALIRLYDEGFTGNQIVVLSPHATGTAATVSESPWKERIRPINRASSGQIGYTTIQAFKGLEAPAVVLTDIDHATGAYATDLLYIGITRALHRLVLLVSTDVRQEFVDAMLRVAERRAGQHGKRIDS